MPQFEGFQSFTSFKELGGTCVSVGEVVSEISRLPLDGILGFVAALTLEMMGAEEEFFAPQVQGCYLQLAIVDDFPQKIPRAAEMYVPGRVPITGGRHVFIHEQNLAWLSHAALLHSNRHATTPEITYGLRCRLFRLLLIINDLLAPETNAGIPNFVARRSFCHDRLRYWQFNRFFGNIIEILCPLARQKKILQYILPEFFGDLETVFEKASGVPIQRYFEVLALFIAHFYQLITKGGHWLSKETLCRKITVNQDDVQAVFRRWVRTPEEYSIACKQWRQTRPDMGELPIYDFVPLRETPLIEARPEEVVCPVVPFFFAKIEDEPFFLLSDFLTGTSLTRLHVAIGSAYEKYANYIVERVAHADCGGKWEVRHSPRAESGEELADSYLQRGDVGIVFEHKGQRPGTVFLRGGEGDRVAGPAQSVLNRLDHQEQVSLTEGLRADEGYVTRGMWQQSKNGPRIVSWAEKEIGVKPNRLFPIITHLSPLRVDSVIREAYLNHLIEKASLYAEDFWEQPQWLHISDLEWLAEMAESGHLDLELLLGKKARESVNKRFDLFLSEYAGRVFIDHSLRTEAEALLRSAKAFFG